MSLTALWTIGAAPWVLILMIVMARTVQPPARRRVKISSGHRMRRIRSSQVASTRVDVIGGVELALPELSESPPSKRRTRSAAGRRSRKPVVAPMIPLALELDGLAPIEKPARKRRAKAASPASPSTPPGRRSRKAKAAGGTATH